MGSNVIDDSSPSTSLQAEALRFAAVPQATALQEVRGAAVEDSSHESLAGCWQRLGFGQMVQGLSCPVRALRHS